MSMTYLLLFLSLPLLAQAPKARIEVIPPPKTLEDFEHEFKGCPENSECDQVMGHQMQRWKELVKNLVDGEVPPEKRATLLEDFREKYGLPVEFYTYKKSQKGFKPLYFNSPCKGHNPKANEDQRVLIGMAFLKSLSNAKGFVWRDQTQHEVPVGELLIPQPVTVYYDDGPRKYQLPLGDQPLFIKNKELYVLREEEDLFYFLKVSPDGKWKIENVDFKRLGEWENKKENATCPVDKSMSAPAIFNVEFCKSIWDEGLKRPVVVKMHQGCPT